ncbi:MAG: hypothetical protein D8M58_21085 [Calditrichaeota bacterium]|nr:MAG: hypothetical protein DWQ03_16800 [Calditrichota bacterium]MBL1207907.1 hypothetical protein [Calditrichota bacterium]NOG47742.1 hypothetical protein [Calditrichota bacterium]
MVSIMSLWLPILISAVFVFVASSIIHMVLKYHNTDYSKLPDEDGAMEALRKQDIKPGVYVLPYAGSMEAMKDEAYIEKMKKGPVGFLAVGENGPPNMGKSLTLWFISTIVIGIFAAYISGRALGPGADYLSVFRFVGTLSFVAYALGSWQNAIWYKHSFSMAVKSSLDALIYAVITAGTFGWLWPH